MCYVMKRHKNHWIQTTLILCHTFCNTILFLVIRFSFPPTLILIFLLMVDFSDISAGD